MELYNFKAHCTRVVDGDTIDLVVDLGFENTSKRRVRLKNIDTPERGREGYQEATDFMESLLLNKDCYLKSYKRGAFGRWIGIIYILTDDGIVNVNDLLVERGFAKKVIY